MNRISKKSNPSFRTARGIAPVLFRARPVLRTESATLPPAKKRRLRAKTSAAAAASAAPPASQPHAPASAASSAAPLPAVARFLPASLLNLKLSQLNGCWHHDRKHLRDGLGGCTPTLNISWATPLSVGYGSVYAGLVAGTQHHVAIKIIPGRNKISAGMELSWCVAVAKHPDIVTILDVDLFPWGCRHFIGLVFERYEKDIEQVLHQRALEIAGRRHVLRKVLSALAYMHANGIVHADLQPANLLMRPEDFAATEWSQWLGMSRVCERGLPLYGGCISPRGCIFKVVVSDLGSAEVACPEQRFYKRRTPGATPQDKVVRLCSPACRPPDLFLGNERYNQAVDMWPLGCVAAELFFRDPLFAPHGYKHSRRPWDGSNPREILKSQVSLLGWPGEKALQVFKALPSTLSDFGLASDESGLDHFASKLSVWGCSQFRPFVEETLGWSPCARLTAASASQHAFLTTPCLAPCLSMRQGRDGPASISSGFLLDEVLEFLQECPRLAALRAECRVTQSSIIEARAPRRLTLEVVGHAENEPPCVQQVQFRHEPAHEVRAH